jgi:hypothetical protein
MGALEEVIFREKWSNMTPAKLRFFTKYADEIDLLLEDIVDFRKELKSKCNQLTEIVEIKRLPNVKQGYYQVEDFLDHTVTYTLSINGRKAMMVEVIGAARG